MIYLIYVTSKLMTERYWPREEILGWFSTYDAARNALINNSINIWHGYYDYAFIQEIGEGIDSLSKTIYFKYNEEISLFEEINDDEFIDKFYKGR